jgi:2-polyprenyl-3-methyl-5-hydroxy-6-metoxy-1,4-benzoquinol methylase
MSAEIPGTQGYAQEAEDLIGYYEGIPFTDKHRAALHLVPRAPARVIDIGAGTGSDAAWLASQGHRVVAVEPTRELREPGRALHPSSSIDWLDDSLPALSLLQARGEKFDLIMMTAVWMHLDEAEREVAMSSVAGLLAPAGVIVMSLRHGPVPAGRRMFDVSSAETIALGARFGLRAVLETQAASIQKVNRQAGVTWSCVGLISEA